MKFNYLIYKLDEGLDLAPIEDAPEEDAPEEDKNSEINDPENPDDNNDNNEELADADTSEQEEEEDNAAKVTELVVGKFIKDYNKKTDFYSKKIANIGMESTVKNFLKDLIAGNKDTPSLQMLMSLDPDTFIMELIEELKKKLADNVVKSNGKKDDE